MADTEPAQAYESGIRRSSRTRAQTAKVAGANDSDEASDRSDRNPRDAEYGDSMDDYLEEARPKAKRKRIPAGPSAAALRVDLPLIEIIKGHAKLIPRAVKYWVERYEENPKPAIIELLLMLFEYSSSNLSSDGFTNGAAAQKRKRKVVGEGSSSQGKGTKKSKPADAAGVTQSQPNNRVTRSKSSGKSGGVGQGSSQP